MKPLSILLFTAALVQATAASANTSCRMVGSQMICTDSGAGSTTTCRTVGSQVVCW